MIDMTKRAFLPAIFRFEEQLAALCRDKEAFSLIAEPEKSLLIRISKLAACAYGTLDELEHAVLDAGAICDITEQGKFYRVSVFLKMQHLRGIIDEIETLMPEDVWPYPSYADMLYSV